MSMTVKDLIEQEIDVDVYDDVCEELGIAFCGPLVLTEAGKEKFAEVLTYPVEWEDDTVIVSIDDNDEKTWKRRLKKAIEFFEAAAGYCAADDYEKWFMEDGQRDSV